MNGLESGFALLPSTPSHICFDKSEFMRDDYKVEQLVSDCRRRVPLEKLRDDLEQYFRLLKTAMVDLINKDYAEFVNLSTNLADLDKAIEQLKPPLIRIKGDVELIETEINNGLDSVRQLLEKKRNVLERKLLLKHLMGLHENLVFLEQHDSNDLVKTAEVWNLLQHNYKHAQGNINASSLEHRIQGAEQRITEHMESRLIDALSAEPVNCETVHEILSAYGAMSKCHLAEEIIRVNLCRPFMQQTLENESIKNLSAIFNSLLDFVPTYLKTIYQLVTGKYKKLAAIPGFDFVSRAVFPEIVSALHERTYLPALFIPGKDEEDFRRRYELSLDMISQLELQCSSQQSVMALRQSQSYATFQNSFPLENYFTIASQKLIAQLDLIKIKESSLTYDLKHTKYEDQSQPRLESTETVISILEKCNSEQVLLPGLLHRFYKLQIQIVYRYAKWATSVMSYASSSPEIFEQIKYLNLVHLHSDLAHLGRVLDSKIFSYLMEKIEALNGGNMAEQQKESIKASTQIVLKRLQEPTTNISNHVQSHLVERSIEQVKLVGDIPRQYRRTNRAVPTESSQYVSTLVAPCAAYHHHTKDAAGWITEMFDQITQHYQKAISEVLEASRKMEASLLKLAQMRKTKTEEKKDKMSDDEKIRLQIRLDVAQFNARFVELGVASDHPPLVALTELVA